MRELLVSREESGQRLDKYLRRHLPNAPSSFIYKMLRKKNITLQGKKADGSEKLETGDSVKLFLSDETISRFSRPQNDGEEHRTAEEAQRAFNELQPLLGPSPVLYEDEDVLVVRKPAGVLSQKAEASDLSMNEWLRGYLAGSAASSVYRPSVCNRLDRNTGGILLCAKTLPGSRALSLVIRDRMIRKTYIMVVHGRIPEPGVIDKDLIKDRQLNRVRIAGETRNRTGFSGEDADGRAVRRDLSVRNERSVWNNRTEKTDRTFSKDRDEKRHAVTVYRPVRAGKYATMVEADLITGRSHQLRVHMASIGHPIVADPAYGDRNMDVALMRRLQDKRERFPRRQLLWCAEVAFPNLQQLQGMTKVQDDSGIRDVLLKLAGLEFHCPPPKWWKNLCEL